MAKLSRVVGSTSNILEVFVQNSSLTTGAGLTGLLFNSASLTGYYKRNKGTASVSITLATITTLGTFATGGFKEVDATNMPGTYEFHPPDAAFASGADSVVFILKGATNMAPVVLEIELTATNNQVATVSAILADGVAHGGTPGSSTATLALQLVNVFNSGGNAVSFAADPASFGQGLHIEGYRGLLISASGGEAIRATADADVAVNFNSDVDAGFRIGGSTSGIHVAPLAGPAILLEPTDGAGISIIPAIDQTTEAAGINIIGAGTAAAIQLGDGSSGAEGLKVLAGTGNTDADAVVGVGAGTGVGFRSTPDAVGFGGGGGGVDVVSVNGTTFVGPNIPAAPADGSITEATISTPIETAGRPTGRLAMLRRRFEWRANKRTRSRSSGDVVVYGADNTTVLETQNQSTAGTADTQTKGA